MTSRRRSTFLLSLSVAALLCASMLAPAFGAPRAVSAASLAKKLAKSEQVKACVVTQWFRYAYGRGEAEADTCTLKRLTDSFAKANYDVRELVIALTQTDAFRFRKAGAL